MGGFGALVAEIVCGVPTYPSSPRRVETASSSR